MCWRTGAVTALTIYICQKWEQRNRSRWYVYICLSCVFIWADPGLPYTPSGLSFLYSGSRYSKNAPELEIHAKSTSIIVVTCANILYGIRTCACTHPTEPNARAMDLKSENLVLSSVIVELSSDFFRRRRIFLVWNLPPAASYYSWYELRHSWTLCAIIDVKPVYGCGLQCWIIGMWQFSSMGK